MALLLVYDDGLNPLFSISNALIAKMAFSHSGERSIPLSLFILHPGGANLIRIAYLTSLSRVDAATSTIFIWSPL